MIISLETKEVLRMLDRNLKGKGTKDIYTFLVNFCCVEVHQDPVVSLMTLGIIVTLTAPYFFLGFLSNRSNPNLTLGKQTEEAS